MKLRSAIQNQFRTASSGVESRNINAACPQCGRNLPDDTPGMAAQIQQRKGPRYPLKHGLVRLLYDHKPVLIQGMSCGVCSTIKYILLSNDNVAFSKSCWRHLENACSEYSECSSPYLLRYIKICQGTMLWASYMFERT